MDQPNDPSHEPQNRDPAELGSQDPGTPISGFTALILAVVLAAGIIVWQNLPEDTQYHLIGEQTPVLVINAESPAPGRFGQFDLAARMFIRGRTMLEAHKPAIMQQFAYPFTPEDQVRAIIMSAEFEDAQSAINRIEASKLEISKRITELQPPEDAEEIITDEFILTELDPSAVHELARFSIVNQELDALKSIYTHGRDSIDQPMRDQLVARYGVLGQAALAYGLDDTDPSRAPVVNGFIGITLLLTFVMIVALTAFLSGLIFLIIGIINLATGKLRFRFTPPNPGGSVFLETYALFLAGFSVMSVGLFVLSTKINPELGILSLPLQWLLVVIPFWALFRGMNGKDWKQAIGFHTGEGVLKEIGCGFLVYLASIPIFCIGILITITVLLVQSAMSSANGTPPEVPENPVFNILSEGNAAIILLVFTLATIWAPFVEELIFRGALYRHLRGRLHWVAAALLSALLFAYMHSYGPLMVAPLIALGFMFAFMRQWRGSIIAPITAHFIHNASLMIFMITLIYLIKDPVIN